MLISKQSITSSAAISGIAIGSALSLISALFPLEPSTQTLALLSFSWLTTLMLYIFCRSNAIISKPESLALLIFLLMTLLSCLIAYFFGERRDLEEMWSYAIQANAVIVLYWGFCSWSYSRFRATAVDKDVLVFSVVCTLSVFLEASGLISYETSGNRYFGFVGDSVAWLISFAATYCLIRRKYTLTSLLVIALLLTQSRGAILIFFVAALALSALLGAGKRNIFRYVFPLAAIAIILAITFPAEVFTQVQDRFYDVNVLENDRTRTTRFTLEIFSAKPLTGSGFGSHTFHYASVGRFSTLGNEFWGTPTSTWAQILADSGLMGFLPFLVFILLVARASVRAVKLRSLSAENESAAALGLWLIAFLFLNHSAAWLLPGSMISPIVFAAAGIVVGSATRSRYTN